MHQIPESELIINNRGAVYHLDLRPEELADTVILVGDPERVKKVSKYFDNIEFQLQHREFITHTGYIGNQRISVMSTGIGPDNIDIAINELDALANIDLKSRTIKSTIKKLNIIRFGTSGALQLDIPVDSLVASTHGLGFDNLMNYYDYEKSEDDNNLIASFLQQTQMDTSITMPYVFKGSELLITVTAPGFYGPQGRELRLKSRSRALIDRLTDFAYDGSRIANFEMESSAIFGLGKLLGHECLSINVVVANRVVQQYSKDSNAAVEKMIEKAIAVILS